MSPRFCITEAWLPLREGTADDAISNLLERLVLEIERCRTDGQEIARWSGLEYQEVSPGVPLMDLMYQAGRLDRVLQRALMEALHRCLLWDAEEEASLDAEEVLVGGESLVAPSVCYAHREHGRGLALACLSIPAATPGPVTVVHQHVSRTIYFVSGDRDDASGHWRAFYRSVPEIEDLDEQSYLAHAALMFPSLLFKSGLCQEFRRFAGTYRSLRCEVTRHLAALNDHFRAVLLEHGGDVQKIEATMRALCHVELSPESGNTKRNHSAWQERKISIDGQDVYCDWHLKLSPTKNRIHFHPGSPALGEGKIIVGIFHEHLTL